MDSISNIMGIALAVQQNKTDSTISMAVMNKAQDLQKQQGEAVLGLISAIPTNPNGIDVYA